MKRLICHSGGCPGADMAWENACKIINVKTIAYSFQGHHQDGATPYVMSVQELNEGWEKVLKAAKSIKRPAENIRSEYVRKLLCRNWFQVKHSDAVFAIGTFFNKERTIVNGGTGWAVQMAIDAEKPVYVFDQEKNEWYSYGQISKSFELTTTPSLTENFAGIGTREINENGMQAIKDIILKFLLDNQLTEI